MPENRNNTSVYTSSLEHLADEFKRLDLLLQRQVLKQQQPGAGSLEQFQGLVISEEEITALFADEQLAEEIFNQRSDCHQDQPWDDSLYELDSKIQQRRDESRKQGLSLPLSTLTQLFQLNPFEERCLIICLAPEIERIQTFLSRLGKTGTAQCLMFYLVGRYGTGRKFLAQWMSQQQGLPLLVADITMLFDGPVPFVEMVRLFCREAVLQPAAVCIENIDYLLSDDILCVDSPSLIQYLAMFLPVVKEIFSSRT